MAKITLFSLGLGLLGLCASTAASSETGGQGLTSIRSAVAEFLTEQVDVGPGRVEIQVSRVDPRLRLARCHHDQLEPFFAPGSASLGRVTVGLRCLGPRTWTLYVPAQVRQYQSVVVLTRPVARNHTLRAPDLRMESRDISRLNRGYINDLADALGQRLVRHARGGTALRPDLLKTPNTIRRGQRVVLVAEIAGIRVQSAAVALADGTLGDRVKARNLRSKRVVEGEIVSRNLILVDP